MWYAGSDASWAATADTSGAFQAVGKGTDDCRFSGLQIAMDDAGVIAVVTVVACLMMVRATLGLDVCVRSSGRLSSRVA